MNQLKRWSSLQRKGFGYDRASVTLDVWDSVVGHRDYEQMPEKFLAKLVFLAK
jgi:hypothetical protein